MDWNPSLDINNANTTPSSQFNYRINNLSELMANRLNMSNIMRTYFEMFCIGHPLIDCKQSGEIIMQLTSFQQFDQVVENMGKSSITLLFLSIQTFCLQRLGLREIAKQLYDHCLQLLSQQMLTSPNIKELGREINLACALITLAFYLVGEGGLNREQAKLFLHNCRYYVSNIRNEEPHNRSLKYRLCAIHKYVHLIKLVLNQDNFRKSFEVIQKMIIHFDKFCCSEGIKIRLLPFKLPPNLMGNEKEVIEYLKKSIDVLVDIFSNKHYYPKMNDIFKLTFKLILNGLQLQFLMDSPNKDYDEMAKLADQITETVERNSETLVSCPILVVHSISLAGKFHLKQQSESFLKNEELVSKVERDLNALRLLERHFGIISSEYAEQIAQMEAWIKQKHEIAEAQTGSALFKDLLSNINLSQLLDPSFFDRSPILFLPSPLPSSPSKELTSSRFHQMFMSQDDIF
jgi:hypothetical protein